MPDRDNLARTLPKRWLGAIKAARQGPEYLAKHLASVTSTLIAEIIKPELIENLASQLVNIAQMPPAQREAAVIELPSGSESSRDGLIHTRAADQVNAELSVNPYQHFTADEVRERLFEEFTVGVPRAYAMGVLATKIPDAYPSVQAAQENLAQCETHLREMLRDTARALAANPSDPQIKRITLPRVKRRKKQEELVATKAKIDLGKI
jgi:hypothetical protein